MASDASVMRPTLRRLPRRAAALTAAALLAAAAARADLEPELLRTEYRAVLGRLAAGQPADALAALLAMESRALEERDGVEEVERLWRAKLSVVRDLLGGLQFDLLPPVLALHVDAYQEYRRLNRPLLARHSADMAAELADFYASRSPDPVASGLASRFLASLGGFLQDGWALASSARLLLRAVELDPGNEVAHLALGALYEKRGEYARAVDHLRRVRGARSQDPELRLRLALCLARAGGVGEAEPMLVALSDAGEPAWVGVLAVEELGQRLAARGELEQAERVLMRGRERFPEERRLAIQMLWVRERRGLPSPLAADLDAVEAAAAGPSPRYDYTRWPRAWMMQMRAELRAAAEQRAPVLARALATAAGEPAS